MSDEKKNQEVTTAKKPGACCNPLDPFGSLPPELRPKQKSWKDDFRKVTCPDCGLVYWTQDSQDLCMDCKKKRHIK